MILAGVVVLAGACTAAGEDDDAATSPVDDLRAAYAGGDVEECLDLAETNGWGHAGLTESTEIGWARVDLDAMALAATTDQGPPQTLLDVDVAAEAPDHSEPVHRIRLTGNLPGDVEVLLDDPVDLVLVLPFRANLSTRETTYPTNAGSSNTGFVLTDDEVIPLGDEPVHRCGVLAGLAWAYERARGDEGIAAFERDASSALRDFAFELPTNGDDLLALSTPTDVIDLQERWDDQLYDQRILDLDESGLTPASVREKHRYGTVVVPAPAGLMDAEFTVRSRNDDGWGPAVYPLTGTGPLLLMQVAVPNDPASTIDIVVTGPGGTSEPVISLRNPDLIEDVIALAPSPRWAEISTIEEISEPGSTVGLLTPDEEITTRFYVNVE